ncbi:MAG TPA: amidohydrolase family protein [Conexibacter sp.]|jgi:predicted TIM-barrel fold metal-dependent hydrolase
MSVADPVRTTVPVQLVDIDIHLAPRDADELIGYMPAPWRDRLGDRRRLATRTAYLPFGNPARMDAFGPAGELPGTEPDLVRRQLFAEERMDIGLIVALPGQGPDPALNAAVAAAINDWQAATWLAEDDARLLGSVLLAIDDVAGAVRELERWAGHPGFRQALIAHDGDRPLGHPQYDPLWQAAARHRLPVAIHFNDSGRLSLGATPVGHFRTYVEYHALTHPLEYAAHVASWICGGVFDRFPDLRFVLLEGGFLWHRPVVARLMHLWERGVRAPGAVKDPLACVRDHIRFSSQPIEEAESVRDVQRLLELAEADRLLLFSSDYPHYDYDNPLRALPPTLAPELRARIMCENARELYGLPAVRPADRYDEP